MFSQHRHAGVRLMRCHRLPKLRCRVRSLMLATLLVAVIAGGGVWRCRAARFLDLSRYYHARAAKYATAEREYADAIATVADLERAVAHADPPGPRGDDGAWSAYRGYLSKLQGEIKSAKSGLEVYEGYRALRRHCERFAATYERAARRPWLAVEAETTCTE